MSAGHGGREAGVGAGLGHRGGVRRRLGASRGACNAACAAPPLRHTLVCCSAPAYSLVCAVQGWRGRAAAGVVGRTRSACALLSPAGRCAGPGAPGAGGEAGPHVCEAGTDPQVGRAGAGRVSCVHAGRCAGDLPAHMPQSRDEGWRCGQCVPCALRRSQKISGLAAGGAGPASRPPDLPRRLRAHRRPRPAPPLFYASPAACGPT